MLLKNSIKRKMPPRKIGDVAQAKVTGRISRKFLSKRVNYLIVKNNKLRDGTGRSNRMNLSSCSPQTQSLFGSKLVSLE